MMKTTDSGHRVAALVVLAACLPLALAGTREANGAIDPDVIALRVLPLLLLGGLVAIWRTRRRSAAYRWGVRVALGAAFVLFWGIGAVGLLGPDDRHPADVLYVGVLAVGLVGAILARFRPRGMAQALFAAAAAQMLVPVVALIGRLHGAPIRDAAGILHSLGLNAFFAAFFVGSGLLFRAAARTRGPARAEAPGR